MSEESKQKLRSERVAAIDFARGLGMFIVLIVHVTNYWAFGYLTSSPDNIGIPKANSAVFAAPLAVSSDFNWLSILIIPFQIMGSWASVFAMITGASTAYILHYQIVYKGVNIKKRMLESVFSAVVLLLIHFLYVYFSMYKTSNINGLLQEGLFPGSIRAWEWTVPDPSFLFIAGPLSMIAFSDLITTLICGLIWRHKMTERESLKRGCITFIVLGMFFIFSAEAMKDWLIPELYATYNSGNYFAAMLLTWLVGSKHCIFPFVGYAFFGAMLALMIQHDHEAGKKQVAWYGYSFVIFFLSVAAIDFALNGMPNLVGPYHPFFLYTLNLGLQLICGTLSACSFDYDPHEIRKTLPKYFRLVPFRRLSTISLTIFMIEESIAGLFTMFFAWLAPTLMGSLLFIMFLFTPIYVYIWMEVVAAWEKNNFKYSFEWLLVCLLKGKNPNTNQDLLGIQKNIYQSSGFESREEYYALKKARKEESKKKK